MKVKVDAGCFYPERAHTTDAGMDLRASEEVKILPHSGGIIGTGVHVELPHGCAGLLVSKSGLNCNHHITSTGLIDEGYTGEIMVKLYNHGDKAYLVHAGDKISQLVVIPVQYEQVELVSELEGGSERGGNGFGSTGR